MLMVIGQTFSDRKMHLIGNRFLPFHWLNVKTFKKKKKFGKRNAFNRKPFLPFHWLNVKTCRKTQKKTPFMESFRFVSVSFSLTKKKNKKKKKTPLPLYFGAAIRFCI